jgi:hypothetical protein
MDDLMYTMVQSAELNELRRLATKYEENKRYIELGKAVEKAYRYGKYIDEISIDELLEWAEGRE